MVIPVTIPYSPKTKTGLSLGINNTVIYIDSSEGEGIYSFVSASASNPGEAVLSLSEHYDSEDPDDYETVRFTGRDVSNNRLTGVTRNVEGLQREWPVGTFIQSNPTATTLNDMRTEVLTHDHDSDYNNYIHPNTIQCNANNYSHPTGDPVCNAAPNANNYVHPTAVQCDVEVSMTPIYIDSDPDPAQYEEGDVILQEVDSGTTANGTWIRFPSGVQMCQAHLVLEYTSVVRLTRTWTFPKPFVDTSYSVSASPSGAPNSNVDNDELSTDQYFGIQSSSVLVNFYRQSGQTNFSSGDTMDVSVIAIGRWK